LSVVNSWQYRFELQRAIALTLALNNESVLTRTASTRLLAIAAKASSNSFGRRTSNL